MIEKMYYSVQDIQTILGCGRGKAYTLIKLKTFPKTKIGGKYYIDKEEFEKWRKRNLYTEIIL